MRFRAFATSIVALALALGFFVQTPYAIEIDLTPSTGLAPFRIHGIAIVEGTIGDLWVDMGGEVFYSVHCDRMPGDPVNCGGETWEVFLDHEFYCPGTYEVRIIEYYNPAAVSTVTVTVVEPLEPALKVEVGASAYEVLISTTPDIGTRVVELAVVEWGDGTTESFDWTPMDDSIVTPSHLYATDGQYTAKITLYYSGRHCSFAQTPTVSVRIPHTSTPTRDTTWGAVKALYR